MSSDLQSTVEALVLNNYITLVGVAAIAYDYILTFPREINYIWNRPWTFVSVMFMLVRYPGLAVAFLEQLWAYLEFFESGNSFHTWTHLRTVLLLVVVFSFVVFLAAADIVMILRVYAIYSRSKIVLGILLTFYVPMVILYAVSAGYYNNPRTYLIMTTAQVLDMSFCIPTYAPVSHALGQYKIIPRLILSSLLFLFAVARLFTEAYQTYKVTKEWKVNRYLNLLVREGVLYFFAHLLYAIDFGQSTAAVAITTVSFILIYILSPRFIISVREMHERKFIYYSGQDTGLDTGFGITSNSQSSRVLVASSIGFVSHSENSEATLTGRDLEMQAVVGSKTSLKH